jgi:hypothetical protein
VSLPAYSICILEAAVPAPFLGRKASLNIDVDMVYFVRGWANVNGHWLATYGPSSVFSGISVLEGFDYKPQKTTSSDRLVERLVVINAM